MTESRMKQDAKSKKAQLDPKPASRQLWLIPIFVLAGVALHAAFVGPFGYGKDESESLRATNLLLIQQLDKLATSYLDPIAGTQMLANRDRENIEVWMTFDQRFMEINGDSPDMQFELASTARRLGLSAILLGEAEQSRSFLDESANLFGQLKQRHPGNISFRIEYIAAQTLLARVSMLEGNRARSLAECQSMIELLRLENKIQTEEHDDAIKLRLRDVAHLLLSLDEPELAASIAKTNVEILERLLQIRGNAFTDQVLLNEAREVLRSSK